MALQFNPYPIPQQQAEPHPAAVAGDRLQKMLALLGEYQLQKSAEAQEKEKLRQQQALEYVKLKADYGDEINGPLLAAGLNIPGLGTPPPVTPTSSPLTAGLPGPADPVLSAPVSAPTPAQGLTKESEFILKLRKEKGRKGVEQYMKDEKFKVDNEKDLLDIQLKKENLDIKNRGKKYVTREELLSRPSRALEPGEELLPVDPLEGQLRGASMQMANQFGNESKDFRMVASAFSTVSTAPPNASGDMQLIYGLMKLYDPTSVVKETEFANAENARGVPDSIKNVWNKARQGTFLTDAQRAEFKTSARGLYESRLGQQRQLETEYKRQAAGYGLNPAQVVRDYSIPNLPPSGGAPSFAPTAGADVGANRYQQALKAAEAALQVNPNDEKARKTREIALRKINGG